MAAMQAEFRVSVHQQGLVLPATPELRGRLPTVDSTLQCLEHDWLGQWPGHMHSQAGTLVRET